MKRICLFAGYDSKNIIHDYVVYYLKELSTVADVYYMADNEVSEHEKDKIASYVKGAYGFNHKKYDFGSWQELINILGWEKLAEYDELILANDSVFGPLYSIKDLFDRLEKDTEWDMCGIDRNHGRSSWYLSSYFLVFRNKSFLLDAFKKHIMGITIDTDVVRNAEMPFANTMHFNGGCKIKCLIPFDDNIFLKWDKFLAEKSPFIKKKAFSFKILKERNDNWKKIIKYHSDYDVSLIDKYFTKELIEKELKANSLKNPKILKAKIRNIRQFIIKINLKKDKKIIRLFGIYLLNKIKRKEQYIFPII